MKLEIQAKLYEETKKLNNEELLKYYHEAVENGAFAEKMKRIRSRQEKQKKAR